MKYLPHVLIGAIIMGGGALIISTTNYGQDTEDVAQSNSIVGVILPLSGDTAFIGEDMQRGIELAAASWPDVDLRTEDSAGDTRGMISAYHKLATEDPDIIIAAGTGVEALIPLAEENKIPLFLTVSSASGLPAEGEYVFRYFTNADTDAPILAHYAMHTLEHSTYGILYLQDQFGIDYAAVFGDVVEARGGDVVGLESFNYGEFDFRTQLTKLKALQPDALYLIGLDFQLIPALQQIKELGMDTQILSLGSIATASAIEQAGDSIEDVYLTAFCTDGSPDSYVEAFEIAYQEHPGFFSEIGYDMVRMLHGTSDAEDVQAGLRSLVEHEANTGPVSIDETGEIVIPMCVKKIVDGKIFNTVTGNYSNY